MADRPEGRARSLAGARRRDGRGERGRDRGDRGRRGARRRERAQEKDVVFNQSIDLKIQDLKSEQYLLDDKLDDNNTAITTIFGNIQVLKNKEKQINEDINNYRKSV